MENQIANSNVTSEFDVSARVHILTLISCVTLNLSLDLIESLFSHITTLASHLRLR